MKKIKLSERQVKLLNELDEPTGMKSAGASLGANPVRVVIEGDVVLKAHELIIKRIKEKDVESNLKFYEATGKIVGTVSEYKMSAIKVALASVDPSISIKRKSINKSLKEGKNLVKITQEQYNRIFASGMINESDAVKGGLTRVDKTFKKEFSTKNVQNLKPVSEDKFKIQKPNPSIPKGVQPKFGKPITENTGDLKNETIELIKYLYRKSEEFSPFWEQHGLTYDDICDALLAKKMIISDNGKYELSKSLGNPQEAIEALENELRTLIGEPQTTGPELETEDSNLPAGAENDPNAPWNQDANYTTPKNPKNMALKVVYYNREIAILKDASGNLYVFYYEHIDGNDFFEYAEVEYTSSGRDEDGFPEYEYSDDFEIDGDTIQRYVNDNLEGLSKGEGVDSYEDGTDLVKIDDELRNYLLEMYSHDKNLQKVLGSIQENEDELGRDFDSIIQKMKDNLSNPRVSKGPEGETEDERIARLKAAIAKKRAESEIEDAQRIAYLEKQRELAIARAEKEEMEKAMAAKAAKELEKPKTPDTFFGKPWSQVEETTGAASSGAFTPALNSPVVKRKLNVPVFGENVGDDSYTHYALFKDNNKIATGWDYSSLYDKFEKTYDNQSIREYAKGDLIDMFPEHKPSDFKIVTKKSLLSKGVDPSSMDSWFRTGINETLTAAGAGNFQYDANALPGINRDGSFKKTKKTKAEDKTQWAGGAFVDFNDCVKLNNKPASAGCSAGAVDNVVKLRKTKDNINAPSLNEALKLQYNKENNLLVVVSDLEGRAGSQETFKNKEVLKKNGFVWKNNNWTIPAEKLEIAKTTLSLVNKAEYIINTLEDLEAAVESSDSDKKSLLKTKLELYINDLANATDEKALSAEIRRYLTFFSKFHDYSFYNRILIFIQKPDATKVASYKKWQEKHRQVKKGAKAISILAPIITKGKEVADDEPSLGMGELSRDRDVTRFMAVNVFDISDTEAMGPEGEIPPTPEWFGDNTPSETADELFGYVSEVASDLGIKITTSDASGGERGYAAGDHINISSGVEGVGRLSTMIHEIAHELMHFKKSSIFFQDDEVRSSSALKELQAESVSYVVLKHYGLPVSHHTTYLALWRANKEKIQSNLEVISKVSQFIIDKIDEEAKRANKESGSKAPEMS